MPNSHRSPYRRHVFGAVAVCLAGAAFLAARQQGWLGTSAAQPSPGAEAMLADADVPAPDDELLEMPPEIDVAQSEPDEAESDSEPEPMPAPAPVPSKKRVRHSQWETASGSPFASDDRAGRRAPTPNSPAKSRIVQAGFEDEAPEPPVGDDESTDRRPAKSTTDAIARKPGETAKGVSIPGAADSDPAKKPPVLMNGDKIQALIDDGDYIAAQRELSQWYWQKPEQRERVLPELNRLAQALYFAPQPQYYEPYVVKPQDQLRVIGQKYKLSWEYLARLNHVDARKIRMGQKLKVVPGPFAAIVFLDRFELVVHLEGSFVKSYRVGVGKDGTTPIGTFPVKNKIVDPTYYGPDGVLSHDDPKNPLGERWIDLGDSYGIHGTIEPDSIGKKESRGCVRMLNSDVEEVYDFLVLGSEVKIVRK